MSEIINYTKTWGTHFQKLWQYDFASVLLAFLDPDASFSLCKTAKIDQVLKKTNANSNSYTV